MSATATKTTAEVKKEFNLERACVLWIYQKDQGQKYLSGRTESGTKLIGFFTGKKQNPKEPDMKIYNQVEKGEKLGDPILSLWVKASDNGKKYISGKIKERYIVGFFNSKAKVNGTIPYINIYFQEDREKPEVIDQLDSMKEPKYEEIPSDESLPF